MDLSRIPSDRRTRALDDLFTLGRALEATGAVGFDVQAGIARLDGRGRTTFFYADVAYAVGRATIVEALTSAEGITTRLLSHRGELLRERHVEDRALAEHFAQTRIGRRAPRPPNPELN